MKMKYMLKRVILIPVLTVLMCMPQFALHMNTDEVLASVNTDTKIEVTINELAPTFTLMASQFESANLVATSQVATAPQSSGYQKLHELKTFSTLRRNVENIFNTTTRSDGTKEGELYTFYGSAASDVIGSNVTGTGTGHTDDPTYKNVLWNPAVQRKLQQVDVQEALKMAAAGAFSDVKPDAWYSRYIPLAVYYGVISGDSGEGGTFRPNASVSRAEFTMMLATAQSGRRAVYDAQNQMVWQCKGSKE